MGKNDPLSLSCSNWPHGDDWALGDWDFFNLFDCLRVGACFQNYRLALTDKKAPKIWLLTRQRQMYTMYF